MLDIEFIAGFKISNTVVFQKHYVGYRIEVIGVPCEAPESFQKHYVGYRRGSQY